MKLMNPAELGSTGAALMSRFHQLVEGKSGSGPGRGPPRVAAHAATGTRSATATISRRSVIQPPYGAVRARPVMSITGDSSCDRAGQLAERGVETIDQPR